MNSRSRQILYYILPSAGGLCVTYLYNIVDGIFVGRGVGALALAAVNITPLAKEYLFFYTAFAIPFLLSNCLAIFLVLMLLRETWVWASAAAAR